jgi:aspartyl-tRNA synthetase
MKRIYANQVEPRLDGKRVFLKGWVEEIRDLKKVKFIVLRDDSGSVQLIASEKTKPKVFKEIPKISTESVVTVEGVVKKSKIAKRKVEVIIKDLTVLSKAQTLPITVTEKGISIDLSKRLDYRSIDLRKARNHAIFNIQSSLVYGMVDYLEKKGFKQVFTPCLMGAASESGSEVFKIDFYDEKAFLRQDPQLHRQLTIAGGMEKIYDIGPSWRAEQSHTTKHICEHRSCAIEMAFLKDETDTMRIEEELVVAAIKEVVKSRKDDLGVLGIKLKVPKTPFPELRFPKIYDVLQKMGKKVKLGDDLDAEADHLLWEYVKKKYKTDFYFFNRFPFALKPFYVMAVDEDRTYARSVDLNCKGFELSSGGQREHRYDVIMRNIKEKKLNPKPLEWFTKFFKYGVPPHGGFALGIERLTMALLSIQNIREVTLFPRAPDRLLP